MTKNKTQKKPNWVCTLCGMYSSRHWNVERHLKIKHQGEGDIVGFTSYLNLVREGKIPHPSYPEEFEGYLSDHKTLEGIVETLMEKEVAKTIDEISIRRIANFQFQAPYIE